VLYLNGLRGADLEDAAQDVQLRLLERAPPDLRSPGAWACTVATRVALDRHRRAATARGLLRRLSNTVETHAIDPDGAIVFAVRAALAGLTPDLRAIVVLRYFADLDIAGIAAALSVPEGTVKSRLSRAQSQLRAALREDPT